MSVRIVFIITAFLFTAVSCKKERHDVGGKEKDFNFTGFTKVYAAEKINLVIVRGNDFKITAKGPDNDINNLELKLTDNNKTLDIASKEHLINGRVDLTVIMPDLEATMLTGYVTATISGFQDQQSPLRTIASARANVTLAGGAVNMNIDVTGNASLRITGSTQDLAGYVSLNGVVNSYSLVADEVDISTSGNAKAYVRSQSVLHAAAAGESRIFYKGNPAIKNLVTSENGQIIKE
jgi:hypothetical protein